MQGLKMTHKRTGLGRLLILVLFSIVMMACGGGGGNKTYSISGTVALGGSPLQGVTVTLSGTSSATTTTYGDGSYTFGGLANGSYTVTPSKAGYTFNPASIAVKFTGTNSTGNNFTATASPIYSIGGTVTGSSISGVLLTLGGTSSATTTTDANGNYTFAGITNGSYTVTPSMAGYIFNPVSTAVKISGANSTGNNFTSTAYAGPTYSISGTVGLSVPGILVTLSNASSGTTMTDASGNYTFTGLTNGSYTVTPSLLGYLFTPVNIQLTINGANSMGNNFTATATTKQMGGAIQGKSLALTEAVSTLAGLALTTGSADGTGSAARFYLPSCITTDGTNLYVADTLNSTIRQIVISTGAVITLAGTAGTTGATDATGTAALFKHPAGITTDGTNLYVADTFNNTIRQIVISTGAVTTLAGTAGTGSSDGTGTAASFNSPGGITTDGTNLYVTDTFNNTIRQIVIYTGLVTTLAGTASAAGSTDGTGSAVRFFNPYGITTDGTNLYVADTNNNTIRQIVLYTGAVTTLAGTAPVAGTSDGTGSAARFNSPEGITTDGISLYVADTYNYTIRKIQ